MPIQADRPYFDEFSCFKYIGERYCTRNTRHRSTARA